MNNNIDLDDHAVQLELVIEEVNKYLPQKSIVLKNGYDALKKYIIDNQQKLLLDLSIEDAFAAAEFGYDIEFVTCALLNYGYMLQVIPEQELIIFGQDVNYYLESLRSLGIYFENYLPWIQTYQKSTTLPKRRGNEQFWVNLSRENRQKAFLGMSPTPEIAIIKLIEHLSLLKLIAKFGFKQSIQEKIAQESISLYASVAEMLGVWALKWQLEDYAFKILQPDIYYLIVQDLAEHRQERQARTDRAAAIILNEMKAEGVEATVTGRVKHIYGLYEKMKTTEKTVREINDSLGIRIIVSATIAGDVKNSEEIEKQQCYLARDILFRTWPPVEKIYENGLLFRDWIEKPKPNGYQSIHTTVQFEGNLLEAQIRSQTMHDLAEYGAAAHWIYKKTGKSNRLTKEYQAYVDGIKQYRQLLEKKKKSPISRM